MKHTCPRCQTDLDLTGVEPGTKLSCTSCGGELQLVPEDGSLPPAGVGGKGCLTCMIPVAVLGLSILVGMVIAWPSVQERIEIGFIEVLRVQARSQDEYRKRLLRDDDKDGEGEYLFVANMPGLNQAIPEGQKPMGLPAELKAKVAKREGVVPLGAYSMVFYLPRADGSWERDTGFPPPADPTVADVREQAFIAYAVPNHPGWLGSRAFVVDQGAREPDGSAARTIWYCDNAGEGDRAPYSSDNIPEAAAAYPTARAALDAPLPSVAGDQPSTDGRVWRPVEQVGRE